MKRKALGGETQSGKELMVDQAASQRVICLIHPNVAAYSNTFIRAHIERLPADVRILHGGTFPRYQGEEKPLLSAAPLPRLIRAVLRHSARLPDSYFQQKALKRFLLRNRVDAVLAEIGPVGVAVMDVCKNTGIPLIVYFRGADAYAHSILEQVGHRYPELFETAAAIFVVSQAMEHHLQLSFGAPPGKLHVNPSGVDTTRFDGADPASAPPVFLAVGRFVDNKGPHLTLLAFEKTVRSAHDARLVMIGDGPLFETCKHLADALGIAGAVEFLGKQPHMEVATAMRRVRAFVQHSIRTSNGVEGSPNAPTEAGASGLPVVATRIGGIPDIVIDGKTGFLVDEGDVAGMAEHMTLLAKDPVLAAQMGVAARDYVRAEFSIERSIDMLWQVIEAVIEQHGSRE